jgi:hypothetical protein
MAYIFMLSLAISSIFLITRGGDERLNSFLTVSFFYLFFIVLYCCSSEILLQDRYQYYLWYKNLWNVTPPAFFSSSNSDFLFQWALKMLPENIPKAYFYLLISSIIFLLITLFLFVLFKKKYISLKRFALMIPFLFLDRLFIDVAVSSLRSSFAIIFFMLAIISEKKYFKFPLLLLSSGFHLRAFLFCVLVNLLKDKLKNIKNFLFFIGLAMLCLRFFGQFKIFDLKPEIATFVVNSLALNDSFSRGAMNSHLLSRNFFVIILLSIVTPYLCAAFVKRIENSEKITNINLRKKLSLFHFSTLSASFGLILFPDFALAVRIFVAPLLVIPIFMKRNYLFYFVLLKLFIFAFIFKKYF